MSDLISLYQQAIAAGQIQNEPSQAAVLQQLQEITNSLQQRRSWLARWRNRQPQGLYIYGPVGVGKTFLLDLFYQHLPLREKGRYHFHHFMQQVDAQLRQRQGQADPLQAIARDFALKYKVLCFDEFLVHDVAYAMILAELLQALFAQGVVLVATSNTRPDDLYLNGVQRARFLPAIAAIKLHCQVMALAGKRDFRLGRAPAVTAWLHPLNSANEARMRQQFEQIAIEPQYNQSIRIQNRKIPTLACSSNAVWFDFQVICQLPRSQLDYLELAKAYQTIFISHVPALSEKDTVAAILLIHLVDVLYDTQRRLIILSETTVDSLYCKGEMLKEFARTHSRLTEMQSEDYLQRFDG